MKPTCKHNFIIPNTGLFTGETFPFWQDLEDLGRTFKTGVELPNGLIVKYNNESTSTDYYCKLNWLFIRSVESLLIV